MFGTDEKLFLAAEKSANSAYTTVKNSSSKRNAVTSSYPTDYPYKEDVKKVCNSIAEIEKNLGDITNKITKAKNSLYSVDKQTSSSSSSSSSSNKQSGWDIVKGYAAEGLDALKNMGKDLVNDPDGFVKDVLNTDKEYYGEKASQALDAVQESKPYISVTNWLYGHRNESALLNWLFGEYDGKMSLAEVTKKAQPLIDKSVKELQDGMFVSDEYKQLLELLVDKNGVVFEGIDSLNLSKLNFNPKNGQEAITQLEKLLQNMDAYLKKIDNEIQFQKEDFEVRSQYASQEEQDKIQHNIEYLSKQRAILLEKYQHAASYMASYKAEEKSIKNFAIRQQYEKDMASLSKKEFANHFNENYSAEEFEKYCRSVCNEYIRSQGGDPNNLEYYDEYYEDWFISNYSDLQDAFINISYEKWKVETFNDSSKLTDKQAKYMTEGEIATYNQLYVTVGKEAALDYLRLIREDLNKRQGKEEADKFLGSLKGKAGDELKIAVKGYVNGIQQFGEGLGAWVFGDEAIDVDDYKNMYILNELSNNEKYSFIADDTYQIATSLGNMTIPSVASLAIAAATENEKAGQAVSSVLLGLSSGGHSYEQSIENGNSVPRSLLYGGVSGAMEAGSEVLIGSIPGIGTNAIGDNAKKLLSTTASKTVKGTIKNVLVNTFFIDPSMEGAEEVAQNYIQGIIDVAFGYKTVDDLFSAETAHEALVAGVYGFITSGIMNTANQSGGFVRATFQDAEFISNSKYGKNIVLGILNSSSAGIKFSEYLQKNDPAAYNEYVIYKKTGAIPTTSPTVQAARTDVNNDTNNNISQTNTMTTPNASSVNESRMESNNTRGRRNNTTETSNNTSPNAPQVRESSNNSNTNNNRSNNRTNNDNEEVKPRRSWVETFKNAFKDNSGFVNFSELFGKNRKVESYNPLRSDTVNDKLSEYDNSKYRREMRNTLQNTMDNLDGKITAVDGEILEKVFFNDDYVIAWHMTGDGVGSQISENGLNMTGHARHGVENVSDNISLTENMSMVFGKNLSNFNALLAAIPGAYNWSMGTIGYMNEVTDANTQFAKGDISIIAIPRAYVEGNNTDISANSDLFITNPDGTKAIDPKYVVGYFSVTPDTVSNFNLNENFENYNSLTGNQVEVTPVNDSGYSSPVIPDFFSNGILAINDDIKPGFRFANNYMNQGLMIVDETFINDMNTISNKYTNDNTKTVFEMLRLINNDVIDYFTSSEDQGLTRNEAYENLTVEDDDGMVLGTNLSDLKDKNVALCSEKSMAAYLILSNLYENGFTNYKPSLVMSYFETETESREPHAFILLEQDNGSYPQKYLLFDPQNPALTQDPSGNIKKSVAAYSLTDEEYHDLLNGTMISPTLAYQIATDGRVREVNQKRTYGTFEKNGSEFSSIKDVLDNNRGSVDLDARITNPFSRNNKSESVERGRKLVQHYKGDYNAFIREINNYALNNDNVNSNAINALNDVLAYIKESNNTVTISVNNISDISSEFLDLIINYNLEKNIILKNASNPNVSVSIDTVLTYGILEKNSAGIELNELEQSYFDYKKDSISKDLKGFLSNNARLKYFNNLNYVDKTIAVYAMSPKMLNNLYKADPNSFITMMDNNHLNEYILNNASKLDDKLLFAFANNKSFDGLSISEKANIISNIDNYHMMQDVLDSVFNSISDNDKVLFVQGINSNNIINFINSVNMDESFYNTVLPNLTDKQIKSIIKNINDVEIGRLYELSNNYNNINNALKMHPKLVKAVNSYPEVIQFMSELPTLFRSQFGNIISEEAYANMADLNNSRFFSHEKFNRKNSSGYNDITGNYYDIDFILKSKNNMVRVLIHENIHLASRFNENVTGFKYMSNNRGLNEGVTEWITLNMTGGKRANIGYGRIVNMINNMLDLGFFTKEQLINSYFIGDITLFTDIFGIGQSFKDFNLYLDMLISNRVPETAKKLAFNKVQRLINKAVSGNINIETAIKDINLANEMIYAINNYESKGIGLTENQINFRNALQDLVDGKVSSVDYANYTDSPFIANVDSNKNVFNRIFDFLANNNRGSIDFGYQFGSNKTPYDNTISFINKNINNSFVNIVDDSSNTLDEEALKNDNISIFDGDIEVLDTTPTVEDVPKQSKIRDYISMFKGLVGNNRGSVDFGVDVSPRNIINNIRENFGQGASLANNLNLLIDLDINNYKPFINKLSDLSIEDKTVFAKKINELGIDNKIINPLFYEMTQVPDMNTLLATYSPEKYAYFLHRNLDNKKVIDTIVNNMLNGLDNELVNNIFNQEQLKETIMNLPLDEFTNFVSKYAFKSSTGYAIALTDVINKRVTTMSNEEFIKYTNQNFGVLVPYSYNLSEREVSNANLLLNKVVNMSNFDSLKENPSWIRSLEKYKNVFNIDGREQFDSNIYNFNKYLEEKSGILAINDQLEEDRKNGNSGKYYNVTYLRDGTLETKSVKSLFGNALEQLFSPEEYKDIVDGKLKVSSIELDTTKNELMLKDNPGMYQIVLKSPRGNNVTLFEKIYNFGYTDLNNEYEGYKLVSKEYVTPVKVEVDNNTLYKAEYTVNGKTVVSYLPAVIEDGKYIIDFTDVQKANKIKTVEVNNITPFDGTFKVNMNNYSNSKLFSDLKYGANQSDVVNMVKDYYVNKESLSTYDVNKSEKIINMIKEYYPNASDVDIVNVADYFSRTGCGYIALANSLTLYLESQNYDFESNFGYPLYADTVDGRSYNSDILALDIFLRLAKNEEFNTVEELLNNNVLSTWRIIARNRDFKKILEDQNIIINSKQFNLDDEDNYYLSNILNSHFPVLNADDYYIEKLSLNNDDSTIIDNALDKANSTDDYRHVGGGHATLITEMLGNRDFILTSWAQKYKLLWENVIDHSTASIIDYSFDLKGEE